MIQGKFEKEFRKKYPQTIGETDRHFDLDNYKDFLEDLIIPEKDKELENLRARVEELESHLKKQVEREEVFSYPNDWILTKKLLEKDWR